MKIYIISNVQHSIQNKLQEIQSSDLLVFFGELKTLDFYSSHKNKIIFEQKNNNRSYIDTDRNTKKYSGRIYN